MKILRKLEDWISFWLHDLILGSLMFFLFGKEAVLLYLSGVVFREVILK